MKASTLRPLPVAAALVSVLALSACGSSDEGPSVVEAGEGSASEEATSEEPTTEETTTEEDTTEEESSQETSEDDDDGPLEGMFGPTWPGVGACLVDAEVTDAMVGDELTEMPTVDCDEEHDSEVFAKFDLPDGPYPSDDEYMAELERECLPAFEEYVGISYDESILEIYDVYPLEEGWEAGDREVICVAYYVDGTTTNEPMKGSEV